MDKIRFWGRWTLLWLVMALLAGPVLAGDIWPPRRPAAAQPSALLAAASQLLASPLPISTVASATPTVTLTPAFTPSPVPTSTPPPATEPQPPGEVRLALDATPAEVRPGDVLTYALHLTNAGQTPLTHLVISDTLPAGLVYVPDSAGDGQYDPSTRHLTWSLEGLDSGAEATFGFQARVRGDVLDDLVVNRVAVTGPDLNSASQAQASVAVVRQAVIPPEGGVLETPSGRLRVAFPPGAVAGPVTARFAARTIRPLAARQAGLAFTFDLQATNPAGQRVTHFARPLTITLQLEGLVNWASRPDFLRPWVAYQDETTGRWVSISPTRVDELVGGVVFTTDHFSPFGAGTSGVMESGWLLNFNDTRVTRFSGGLTWAYDFDLPPGPGGVQPGLRLSYNSRRLDGVLTWGQSDGVGWGWNLDRVEVLWRNVHRCPDGANYFLCWDATPLLVLNGEALKLVPETTLPADVQYLGHSSSYRFRTEDDRLWRVRWRTGQAGVDGWQPEADGRDGNGYWEVRLRDGTRYLLGTTPDSRQTLRGNIGGVTTPVANRATVRWRLKRLVYPIGVSVDYAYEDQTYEQQCTLWGNDNQFPQDESCNYGGDRYSERANYLREITYAGTRVELNWDRRWNGNGPNDGIAVQAYRYDYNELNGLRAIFWQTDALQSVGLKQQQTDGTWLPMREWRFTYGTYIPQDESNKRLRLLDQLQVGSPQGHALPAFSFGYTGYPNKATANATCPPPDHPDYLQCQWNNARFDYPRLTRLDNGYGGGITADYATRDGGHWQAWNYRVAQRTVTDGQGGGWQEGYAYSDGDRERCYLAGEDAGGCRWPDQFDGHITGGLFLGYREVTVTFQSLAGAPFKQTYARFALPDDRPGEPDDPWPRRGRPKVEAVGEAGAIPVRQITHTWAISATVGGANFVYLAQQDTTTEGHTTRTEYSYDAYGNVTRTIEHGNVNVAGDERTTHYRYHPKDDGTTYIVDRVARESVYAGLHPIDDDDPNTLQSRTRYHYDLVDPNDPWSDPQAWTDLPAQGRLTQVDAWHGGPTGDDSSEFDVTGYRYDDYGNSIRVTDPLSRTTTTDYDTLFHTYPVTRTNALGQVTLTQYYGVNGAPATGAGAFFGQIEAVTDPNGATTTYAYDVFGRLETIHRPGDEAPAPATVQYTYFDNPPPVSLPFRIQVDRRQDTSTVLTSHRFYDGLGRLIETKGPLPNNQQAVQHTTYDAQGRVAEEYVPYTAPADESYVPVDTGKPRTGYAYDALGRPTDVTHPDGTTTSRQYYVAWNDADPDFAGGRQAVDVTDANGYTIRNSYDAYANLQTATEFVPGDEYRTRYAYNVLDLLTVVTDTTGNTTTIDYDPLGRKTGMDDPDMGEWFYAYDAAGNLTQQTDARGCTTTFSYDAGNRLTGKTYSGPAVCSTPVVSYTYDDGANGKGRRTGMTDASGNTAWGYDARGRVVTETKTIGALGTYTTTYSYNSQDRVVSTTYPDSEVVTTTYNFAGWPATLSSSLEAGAIGQMSYNGPGPAQAHHLHHRFAGHPLRLLRLQRVGHRG